MKKGFTLVELLAVVLMIAILSGVALPQYRRTIMRSRVTEAKQMLPAVFDSTQRWLFENQADSTDGLKFSQLDVSLKGAAVDGHADQWETPNFTYTYPKYSGGSLSANATAEMNSGKYAGLKVYYNGARYTCCPPSGADKANFCTDLDLDKGSC